MNQLKVLLGCICMTGLCLATPQIINMAARQVKPWPGLVEISYELTEDVVPPDGKFVETHVVCEDREHGETYRGFTFTAPPTYEKGVHRLIWNARANGVEISSTNCVFKVVIEALSRYCIIDLSGGTSATNYPVIDLPNEPSGGWTDEYKTSKLVLRYIEPGTFTMGDQVHGGTVYTNIQLTAGFYIGVFEVTQRQWELVMGNRPSYFANTTYYATRPVEQVSYNMIRGSSLGAQWPASDAVDATSFLGKLRERTGLNFDLPTEAQWEYACRAGTTTDYNDGTNYSRESINNDPNMTNVGRYYYNGGSEASSSSSISRGTAIVGSYVPNAWGLYDMHGNVREWCLDWYGSLESKRIDPRGASSGSSRVYRGGSWYNNASSSCSSYRSYCTPSNCVNALGFRLSRML